MDRCRAVVVVTVTKFKRREKRLIHHHATCTPNYPEKVPGEKPQHVQIIEMDGEEVHQCTDCGAFETVKWACADCGKTQSANNACEKCGSVRVVLIRIITQMFGPKWKELVK